MTNCVFITQNWFFWTWKIGNSSVTGKVESPLWSYQLGLDQGWMPTDPRKSYGTCAAAGDSFPLSGPISPSVTGGHGAGTIVPTFLASYGSWPPASLADVPDVAGLPTYTSTGSLPTLAAPTFTAKNGTKIVGGSGWYNSQDTGLAPVNVTGCQYPDAWLAEKPPTPIPTTMVCTGQRRMARMPKPTSPPS